MQSHNYNQLELEPNKFLGILETRDPSIRN